MVPWCKSFGNGRQAIGRSKVPSALHRRGVCHAEPTWQELYKAALLELDPEKLNQRFKAARRAVHQRLNAEDETTTHEEHDKLDDALRMLYVLTRGSGIA
jgi:hypothetical protein